VKANQSLLNLAIRETGQTPAERIFSRPNPKKQNFTDSNSRQDIGKGKFGAMTFRSGINQTFIMNFTVAYSPSKEFGALNDPALNEVIQLCVEGDTRFGRRTTVIGYEAKVDLRPLSSIGLAPKLSNEIRINCPFQGAARDQLLSALKGAANNGGSASGAVPTSPGSNLNPGSRLLRSNQTSQIVTNTFAHISAGMIEFVG
jgi:hypothetical protein